MRKSGTIALYSATGIRLAERRYDSVTLRRYIMQHWQKIYRNYRNFYFHITPDVKISDHEPPKRKSTTQALQKQAPTRYVIP